MPAMTQALAPWHDFYALLGSASATMVALLFVAASVGSGMFSRGRPGALRMFLSASVVKFCSVLAISLIALAPIGSDALLGLIVTGCGLVGLGYCGMAWHGAMRDGITAKIDLEDRLWYGVLPLAGYLCETASGIALAEGVRFAGAALAVSVGVLLLAAIHNAWDITVWSITRQSE